MALRRALVDRCRAVYWVEDTGQEWVEGEPWAEQQVGPWMRCRLIPEQPTEGVGVAGLRGLAARGYHRIEASAKLLVGLTFLDGSSLTDGPRGVGEFVAFDDAMLLQVQSEASPDGIWHVISRSQPLRKRRRVIGFEFALRRSREPGVTERPLDPEGTPQSVPIMGAVRERAKATIEGGEPGL